MIFLLPTFVFQYISNAPFRQFLENLAFWTYIKEEEKPCIIIFQTFSWSIEIKAKPIVVHTIRIKKQIFFKISGSFEIHHWGCSIFWSSLSPGEARMKILEYFKCVLKCHEIGKISFSFYPNQSRVSQNICLQGVFTLAPT